MSATSPQTPDLEALARRYLDLWQDQATALAGDAELASQLGRWLTLMQSGMAHAFQTAASASDPRGANPDRKPTPGAAAPAAPSGGSEPRLDELARRLAAIEERLARLEAGAGGGGKAPRGRARRSRS